MSALDDLKSDESFVDVTLSCDGETIQVAFHLLSTEKYFKKFIPRATKLFSQLAVLTSKRF